MKLRDLNIGVRLALGMGSLLLMAGLLLGASIVTQDDARTRTAEATREASDNERLAQDLRLTLLSAGIAIRNMGLAATTEGVQAAEAVAKKERARYREVVQRLEAVDNDAEEKAMLAKLAAIDQRTGADFTEAVELASQFNTEQAAKIIATKIDPGTAQAQALLAEFVALQQRRAQEVATEMASMSRFVDKMLGLAGFLTLLVSGGISWWLARGIVRPIRAAMQVAANVAAGDLTTRIEPASKDETGRLLVSLQSMNAQLQGMVGQVLSSTNGIATASAQIATGNQELSTRTEQTASSLQQASSSLQELSRRVGSSAEAARQVSQLATGANSVAVRGGDLVAQVVATMGEISQSSRRIGDIIGVIDGIAFQTNILALNAAVEAARAGESGRGFAVVASEVRGLAKRSAEAAREIKVLIGTSVERVEAGTQLVDSTGSTMGEIVEQVKRVAVLIGEISAATVEQTAGIGQVSHAVDQLDQSTQQNAALVEESANAAASMQEQAQQLMRTVGVFKLQA